MECSIFAVFCAILPIAHSNESSSSKLNQPTGKMNDASSSQLIRPLSYSSVVYFGNNENKHSCLGVLIAPQYALTDGTCGSDFMPVCDLLLAKISEELHGESLIQSNGDLIVVHRIVTKAWIGLLHKTRNTRIVQQVIYENKEENTNGLAVTKFTKPITLSDYASLGYLPHENRKIESRSVATVLLRADAELKVEPQHINYTYAIGFRISPRLKDLSIGDVTLGAPLFQGKNLIGIGYDYLRMEELHTTYFRKLQNSCEFLEKFAPCGEVFNPSYHDPAQRGIEKSIRRIMYSH